MSNPEVHAAAVGANNADVANGNITDNNIRRAFDGLRKFLDEKVPKPALLVRLWDKCADLLWFNGLFSSLIVFLYAAEESSKLFKVIGVLIVFVFWVLLAVWISKRNKHKQMNVTAKRYKVLHYLLYHPYLTTPYCSLIHS